MSEPLVIRTRNLRKVYRLYTRPRYRVLDMLGLLQPAPHRYTEHAALDGIDLEVRRGEKIAIIGSNGAGKSTLLKLLTGAIRPTAGELHVATRAHTLLQLGAGFHEEFSGRENARAFLAHMGLAGAEIDEKLEDVVDFAEIHEYIDQPVRNYSTGMVSRLMFAAATVTAPDLLVIDELLSVGDAYFASKSFSRIEEMCKRHQTTLILVSHDVYTAAKICERMAWIDRGRIKFDGDSKTALNLYELSIKAREEQRLRQKAMLVSTAGRRARTPGRKIVLMELRPAGAHLNGPISVETGELRGQDGRVCASLSPGHAVGDPPTETGRFAFETVDDGSNWRYEAGQDGTKITLLDHGSVFQKGVLKAELPSGSVDVFASLVLTSDIEQSLLVLVYGEDHRSYLASRIDLSPRHAAAATVPFSAEGLEEHDDTFSAGASARPGSGGIRINSVDILDASSMSTRRLRQGANYTLEFGYELTDPKLADASEMVIAVARDGVIDCLRIFNSALNLSSSLRFGVISCKIHRFPLSLGKYTVTTLIARRGFYEKNPQKFFTLNNDIIDSVLRSLEFEVVSCHAAFKGTIVKYDGEWNCYGPANEGLAANE